MPFIATTTRKAVPRGRPLAPLPCSRYRRADRTSAIASRPRGPQRDEGLIPVPRFQTDDDFYDDPAVAQAGTAAVGLYFRCGVYVARKLLDGFVPASTSAEYGTPEWVKRLVDAGLWEIVPGGHYMPLYFAHGNPTRAKVLADRQAKSERQQRWLEKQRNASSGQRRVSRRSNSASDDASGDAPEDDALPPSLKGRKGPRARAQRGASAPTRQSPLVLPVEDQHAYEPDGNGTCQSCGLPEINRRHLEAS